VSEAVARSPQVKQTRRGSLKESMSFTDAAEFILEKHGGKKPMHYREITAKALELGLVDTKGRTPEATLYAQILTEIERTQKRGDTPRFVKHGRGMVGLRKWMSQGIGFQIERHNNEVRRKLHQQLRTLDFGTFEALVGRLLGKLGFDEVEVTRRSGDGGIDVRGKLVVGDVIRTRMAVQAKRWKQNVQSPVVQQMRGSLGAHEQGLIITTSDFSSGARREAERSDTIPVALMNGEQFVALLIEHGIGVTKSEHVLVELGSLEEE
jgi:restriction system protein